MKAVNPQHEFEVVDILVNVLIVTESRFYGETLGQFLNRDNQLNVCGVAGNVEIAACHIGRNQPDVVLYDIRMPQGLLGVPSLTEAPSRINWVALAVPDEEAIVLACAEAGFDAYVPQGASADDVKATILATVRGELLCSPRIAHCLCRKLFLVKRRAYNKLKPEKLTIREIDVLELLEQGISNKEVAHKLGICQSTVKNHVHSILAKLSVRSRGEAAAMSRRYREVGL